MTAATVVLSRHGQPVGRPWQCFMVRRHVLSDFAADVYVFPGGKVDEADRDLELERVSAGHSDHEVPAGAEWRAIRLAAVRELFEEAGVLLARRRDGHVLRLQGADAGRFDGYRRQFQAGTLGLAALADREDLIYELDALHPISRWITPDSLPRRYDTYFFAAVLPDSQDPDHDRLETTEGVWVAPREALQRYQKGEFPLVFATEEHLRTLARYRSIEELIAACATADLNPVMPKIVREGGELRFLLPGDPDYAAAVSINPADPAPYP